MYYNQNNYIQQPYPYNNMYPYPPQPQQVQCINNNQIEMIPFLSYSNTIKYNQVKENENSIIRYILDYFKLKIDVAGYICEDIGDEYEENLARIYINNKAINIDSTVVENTKNVILFNPFRSYIIAKYLLERVLSMNNIDNILTIYVLNNILYLKDFDGIVVRSSDYFEYNINLCYLDMILNKLLCIGVSLKEWDVNEIQ